MAIKGQWVKVTGGDQGIYFDGYKWIPFECVGCMFAKGIIKPTDRLQLVEKAVICNRLLNSRANNPLYIKHDREIHNKWILDGKPILV
jgi:hypothetical protein